jgi:hypothetical protein
LGLQIPEEARVGAEFKPGGFDVETDKREGCSLRAGNEKWGWDNGELLVFDDCHVHEAWNFTPKVRVILLLDFSRPPEFLPPAHILEQREKEQAEDPFRVGSRGDVYLDSLTGQHGWDEVIEK